MGKVLYMEGKDRLLRSSVCFCLPTTVVLGLRWRPEAKGRCLGGGFFYYCGFVSHARNMDFCWVMEWVMEWVALFDGTGLCVCLFRCLFFHVIASNDSTRLLVETRRT